MSDGHVGLRSFAPDGAPFFREWAFQMIANPATVLHRDDRDSWTAEAPCYEDPEVSLVRHGKTQQEAVDDLISQPQFQQFLKRSDDRARRFLISQS